MTARSVRFRSTQHPGSVTVPVAFGSYLVRPIAATMTPVMIVGLIRVLQEQDPLPFVAWAAPAALALAGLWTWYRLRTAIVEIVVTENGASALTVVEALRGAERPKLQRVFDVRQKSTGAQVTIGHATYLIDSEEWPELRSLSEALERAKAFYE